MNTDSLQPFLSQAGWVRELALRLVDDPHQADDLVQEAWIAAMGAREPIHSTRAWLAGVVRRLAWQRLRGDDRRQHREEIAARGEATDSTSFLVERMSTHQTVVERVMALPENYRTVILWRYFEGEMPAEIAAREGIPVSTVKTRLQRALARLREDLDDEYGGDGKAWIAALIPLAEGARRATTIGSIPVVAWVGALALAGLLGVLGTLAWKANRGPRSEPVPLALTAAPAPENELSGEVEEQVRNSIPVSRPSSSAVLELDEDLVRSRRTVAGRVIGLDGQSVQGVVLSFEPAYESPDAVGGTIAISNSEGAFTLRGVRGAGHVIVTREDLTSLFEVRVSGAEAPADLTLVVVPRSACSGRVVGPDGRPLPEARVQLLLPPGLRHELPVSLADASPGNRVVATDDLGQFELSNAPALAGILLRVEREGYVPLETPASECANASPDLVLEPLPVAEDDLRGRVLDPMGRPVADARVSFGRQATRTNDQGLFHLPPDAEAQRVTAVHGSLGLGFALLEGQAELEIVLAGEPLTLRGQVVGAGGAGRSGCRVWIDDPSLLTTGSGPGAASTEQTRFSLPKGDVPVTRGLPEVAETYAIGRKYRPWTRTYTDAEGNFELQGLGPRGYRIAVLDPATLEVRVFPGMEPGADARFVFERGELAVRRGRVVDPEGRPVAGVALGLTRNVEEVRSHGNSLLSQLVKLSAGRTDGEGHFELPRTASEGVTLELTSPWTLEHRVRLTNEVELTVVLETVAQLRVRLGDPALAQGFRVLSESGEPLVLERRRGHEQSRALTADLVNGHSETWRVPATAAEIELWDETGAVMRSALRLVPGELLELEL